MECSIINPALSLLIKHLVLGQRQKAPHVSAFHWSPHGSQLSVGQHFVTTRVVHTPKKTETSLITKTDRSGPLTQSNQAVWAVHSSNSWLLGTLRCMGTLATFLPCFQTWKGDNFHDFLFASFADIAHPIWRLPLKKRICSKRSKFFPLRVNPSRGGKQI